jgi:quinoprotein relay system zinc metallohydrolase 1
VSTLRRLLAALLLLAAATAGAADLDYRLKPRELAPGVYVIEGAVADFSPKNGCNIINTGFIVTDAGVVVINTGPSLLYGRQQRAAIARVTMRPVVRVLNLNLHPDYFFGNQAYADVPVAALPGSIAGMRREGAAYADNLYRLCGDWLKGTEPTAAGTPVAEGVFRIGGRELEFLRFAGHTDDDLVVIDRASGVMFAGGLVFFQRVPTTPHARIPEWLAALDELERRPFRTLVPSHGPVVADGRGIGQTRAYLRWIDRSFDQAARRGLDMAEVLALPVPAEFRGMAALDAEFGRNVMHLYPRYEERLFHPAR